MIATARIAVEHGSFNCIRHVSPTCTQCNTWLLDAPSHPPNRKYLTNRNAVREGPSHGHKHLTCCIQGILADKRRQTDRQTYSCDCEYRVLKGKPLELSTPNLVHIYIMTVARHALTLRSIGQ